MTLIGKDETLMLLRSYQCHPGAWGDVIDEIKMNIERLPPEVQRLYSNAPLNQLIDRLAMKLEQLLASKRLDKNIQIRYLWKRFN